MGAFEFQALDERGRTQKGILEGDAERHVRSQLRDRGLTPLSVVAVRKETTSASPSRSFSLSRRRRISSRELALVTSQFATLVRAGLSIEECLNALIEQSENIRVRSVMAGVRSRVMEGRSLMVAMADFPETFPDIYRSLIGAGEQSGRLEEILDRLADYTEDRQALQQQVSQAFIYPAVVSVFCLGIVSFLMVYVVPKVTKVFQHTDQALPLPTRIMIGLSDHITTWGLWWLGGVAVAVILAKQALRQRHVREKWHRWLLRMPIAGRLIRGVNAARMASTLGILTSSGIPLLQALRSAIEVVNNLPMRHALEDTLKQVSEGGNLSRSLGKTKMFPPMVIHLIASGESSGRLDIMLMRASETQSRELGTWVKAFTALLEPALIILMGIIVLFIVLSILLPIFEMNQFVR